MSHQSLFKIPVVSVTEDGHLRKIGFELEFSGLSLRRTVRILAHALNGEAIEGTVAEQIVRVDSVGDFNVELDWEYLKRKASQTQKSGESEVWVDQLSSAASVLVPIEIVCPPIPVNRLDVLNPVVEELRNAGAVGTSESFLSAYGVHINVEIPDLNASTLLSYLKAFALLQWWLVEAHEVDITRKLSQYVKLYSDTYLKEVLSMTRPDMTRLMTGYLEHNATRNRALDLLPLLSYIDADHVSSVVEDTKINPRPAFHYRLPNCSIEKKGWSLSALWNNWWVIEELAHRPRDIETLGSDFFEADQPIIGVNRNEWVEYIGQWLKNQELV